MRIVLDIETMKKENNYYKMGLGYKDYILIGIYDGKRYLEFTNFVDCLNFIFNESKETVIYAHNGGKYDYMYLLEECIGEFQFSNIIKINSSLTFTIHRDKRLIRLKDSLRLLPSGLDELGKAYGVSQKMKLKYNYPYPIETISKYLRQDCITLWEVLEAFEKEITQLSPDFQLESYNTIAGLSFSLLQKELNGLTQNYFNRETEDWIRLGYYGGRTEAYKRVGNNLFYYDVNSLYPFAMRENLFPYGKSYYETNEKQILRLIEENSLGLVEGTVEIPENIINPLPYRHKKKLYFPYGTVRGVYTSVELKQAIKYGCAIKPVSGMFFKHSGYLFRDFIDRFYKLKENSTGAKREIAKLILNTTYGKYGQRRKMKKILTSEEYFKRKTECALKGINEGYEDLGNSQFFSKDYTTYRNRKINPLYAVFITAYARIYMYEIMSQLGFNNIYYTDTDSIITSKELPKELVHNSKIGLLKREFHKVGGYFLAPKLYGFTGINLKDEEITKIKMKGVDRDIRKHIGLDEFETIHRKGNKIMDNAEIKDGKFRFKAIRMVGFSSKFSTLDYKNNNEYAISKEAEKELTCAYEKRKLIGNIFYPLSVKEIEEEQTHTPHKCRIIPSQKQ